MGKDFTYALRILQTFSEAGIKPSTIESVIQGMQIGDAEKRSMSILNHGLAKEGMKFPDPNLMNYLCYKTMSEDSRKEFNLNCLILYVFQMGTISYN